MKYLNAYAVSRAYGGPEEGGWWYDVGVPLASVPLALISATDDPTDEQIEAAKTALRQTLLKQNVIDPHELESVNRFSVCGNGDDLEIYIEEETAKAYPDGRPHYE